MRGFARDSSESPIMKLLSLLYTSLLMLGFWRDDSRAEVHRLPTMQATRSYSCLHLTLHINTGYHPHFTEIINFAKNQSKLLTLPKTEPQLPQRSSINVDPAMFKSQHIPPSWT